MSQLSHFDETGASRMVNVGGKEVTARVRGPPRISRCRPKRFR